MNINIYTNYEINVTNKYSYLNEEGDYTDGIEKFTKIMQGGELAEFIAKQLNDKYLSSINITNATIIVSMFDPMDGTTQHIEIDIKEQNSVFEKSSKE